MERNSMSSEATLVRQRREEADEIVKMIIVCRERARRSEDCVAVLEKCDGLKNAAYHYASQDVDDADPRSMPCAAAILYLLLTSVYFDEDTWTHRVDVDTLRRKGALRALLERATDADLEEVGRLWREQIPLHSSPLSSR